MSRVTKGPTALGFALLALLVSEPLSGSELSRLLSQRVSHFWNATHSQIYPELAKLTSVGFATFQVVEQKDRPDKKEYSITDAGRQALRDWLTSPLADPVKRDELVVRVYAIGFADRPAAITLFADQAERHRLKWRNYQGVLNRIETEHPDGLRDPRSSWFGPSLALRRGLSYELEYSNWCEMVAQSLRDAPPGD
jgi:DNA-binding PadR family transcriptional regulator